MSVLCVCVCSLGRKNTNSQNIVSLVLEVIEHGLLMQQTVNSSVLSECVMAYLHLIDLLCAVMLRNAGSNLP